MLHDAIEQNPALTVLLGCRRQQQCFLALLHAEADESLIEQPAFSILLEVLPQSGGDCFSLARQLISNSEGYAFTLFRLLGAGKAAPFFVS